MFGRPGEQNELKAQTCARWLRDRHPFALASVILAVFSLTHFGILLVDAAAAIILGALALRKLSAPNPPYPHGHRLAVVGMSIGTISLVLAILIYAGALLGHS